MDLEEGKNWKWSKRKLACRVRPETGNPAGDDLRERFAELAGADLKSLLDEMKMQKKKKEEKDKGVSTDYDAEKKFREVLGRSHILGASKFALEEMKKMEEKMATTVTQKNLKKVFARIPESPPRRVLLEIQRERSKPLQLPNQDEINASAVKLEKKLEKEYRKRRAALEASEREEEAKRRGSGPLVAEEMVNTYANLLPRKDPDLFSSNGPYLKSMLYLSRNAHTMSKSARITGGLPGEDGNLEMGVMQAALIAAAKREEEEQRRQAQEEREALLESAGNGNDIGAKLYCAAALCNWSRNPSNAARLASEGGVRAIMQLSLETDPRILRFCAAAFRFMSDNPQLAIHMIDEGAVVTISDLVKSTTDDFITTNLTIALVSLTITTGRESSLVEGTIVLAFTHIVGVRPELGALCARGLYNLTCVDNSYPLIDRVIRYLVTLSSTNVTAVKHICASALCNLSDLKQMRGRLVEESVCSALSTLCRNTPTRTRRVCAVILQNLSATKSCRVEMVIRSAVHVAHSLSHDADPIILRCVGLTLARLSMEAQNCPRIIQEYGVTALSNIATKFPTISGISQPVATAFQMLASRPGIRVQAVNEGCVTPLAVLLRLSQDPFTLQLSVSALCQLLTEAENHLSIVQQGLLITLVTISGQDNDQIRHLCALAFLNFSKAEESHKHMVNAGSIAAIIILASQQSVLTRRRCANALCNVSAYEAGKPRMVQDGIVPALVDLLCDDILTNHYACVALCRLCTCEENITHIVQAGAVPRLVQFTLRGETSTKQYCGAVLSALSQYASCRQMLCEFGTISALKNQSGLSDDVSQLRCLVAFANISCEAAAQEQMVNEGVVEIIAQLIANSYHEKNYTCCAKALCNLACSPGTRLAVARGGGVQALMLISMVHSVNKETKLLCVQALSNLLDETTIAFMLDEGLTTSLANLCKIDSERVANLCAKIFNQLSRHQEAMYKIVEKPPVTAAIYSMAESSHVETAIISCRTTANLVLCGGPVRQRAVATGALRVLERGAQLEDRDAAAQCLVALFFSCNEPSFLAALGRSTAPLALVGVALRTSGDMYANAAKTLAMLAHEPSSRPFLQNRDFVRALVEVIDANLQPGAARWLAQALRFTVSGYGDVPELVQLGVMRALLLLHALDGYADMSACAAEMVRCLCAGSDAACLEVSSPELVGLLERAVAQGSPGSAAWYNCAQALYALAQAGPKARLGVSCAECVPLLCALAGDVLCADLVIAAIFLLLNDPKTRYTFAVEPMCAAIATIFDFNKNNDVLYNCVSAVYALSRLPACLEMLARPPISLDQQLLRVSAMEEPRLKANCARALKNMASDSTEAIEEGAVAALIAMSLEGKAKNNKVSDDLAPPAIAAYAKDVAPACFADAPEWSQFAHVLPKTTLQGGDSDTDIALPEPPVVADSSEEMLFPADEGEGEGAGGEGRAKMAFAKMQVPAETRDQALLRDEDFAVKEDDGEDFHGDEGGDGGLVIQNDYETYDDNGDVIRGGIGASSGGSSEEKRDGGAGAGDEGGDRSAAPFEAGSPKGTPKQAQRKSLASPGGGASPKEGSPTDAPRAGRRASDEKKGEAAGGKKARAEKNMKTQAAQLGLY